MGEQSEHVKAVIAEENAKAAASKRRVATFIAVAKLEHQVAKKARAVAG
jgi:hypothetical protein